MVLRPSTAVLVRRLRGQTPALRRRPESFVTSRHMTPCLTSRSCNRSFSSTDSDPHNAQHPSSSDPHFTTVSPDEVSHFNALASSWWDPHGPSRILHLMNPLRHDFIRMCHNSVLDAPPPPTTGLTYLDIGCGGGIFAESAARLPGTKSVTAIDPSPEVLTVARAHARRDPSLRNKLQYINTPIEQLQQQLTATAAVSGEQQHQQLQYDVVSVFEVLEHVSNPAEFLDRCAPFVRPGGWLVMSTIARTWLSWFTTNLMAEDVLRIVPRGTHDWHKYVNEAELRGHFMGSSSSGQWAEPRCMGVVYVPGVGWREVRGSEKVGNYFFAVRRTAE